MFKRLVIGVAVVWYKLQRGRKSGNSWWTNDIKNAVGKKRKAYKRMFQRNVLEEVKEKREKGM